MAMLHMNEKAKGHVKWKTKGCRGIDGQFHVNKTGPMPVAPSED